MPFKHILEVKVHGKVIIKKIRVSKKARKPNPNRTHNRLRYNKSKTQAYLQA